MSETIKNLVEDTELMLLFLFQMLIKKFWGGSSNIANFMLNIQQQIKFPRKLKVGTKNLLGLIKKHCLRSYWPPIILTLNHSLI